jgi:hypothetical protein
VLDWQAPRRSGERLGFEYNPAPRSHRWRSRQRAPVSALVSAASFISHPPLSADLVLIDEERARRAARVVGVSIAGSIAILERGAKLSRVTDLRSVYSNLLDQGIHYDRRLLNQSLEKLGLAKLQP